jgi:hypothetical protein
MLAMFYGVSTDYIYGCDEYELDDGDGEDV